MPDLDFAVPFPVAKPAAAGDVVLYSDIPALATNAPPKGAQLGSAAVSCWYKTDATSVLKIQFWDAVNKAWVTVNNAGAGVSVAANTLTIVRSNRVGGQMQIVATLGGAPTVWDGPQSVRLHKVPFPAETP